MISYASSPADQKVKCEPANLENDTEKKRANNKESIAKIPKSETSRDVKD